MKFALVIVLSLVCVALVESKPHRRRHGRGHGHGHGNRNQHRGHFDEDRHSGGEQTRAICVLHGDGIQGQVTFTQTNKKEPVDVNVKICGLAKGSQKHAFHIHEFGDESQPCVSAGSHFNPFNKTHGGPHDHERHAGDLGNFEVNEHGCIETSFHDAGISLMPKCRKAIIGRSCVLHVGEDDLGKGQDEASKTTGNAGGRLACGVVGFSKPLTGNGEHERQNVVRNSS